MGYEYGMIHGKIIKSGVAEAAGMDFHVHPFEVHQ